MKSVEPVVIGAGQAGLSAAHHLARLGIGSFVVLDANERPGGAWQHRWDSLTMRDVHGVADLPGMPFRQPDLDARANEAVPAFFAAYEGLFDLPVERPVRVTAVAPVDGDPDGLLRVETTRGTWLTRSLVNATGTWETPFRPYYPGIGSFRSRELHTVDYAGPEELAGQRVVVVGGGASAVQVLGELAPVAESTWVTRREPVWRTGEFDENAGREAVAMVEDRVARGLPPRSVVGVTGLMRRLAPLHLRTRQGGIQLLAPLDRHTFTSAVRDHRVHFVGYGPSASTIGASRAGRAAARAVREQLAGGRAAP